ncbi:hypothetical protein RRG08_042386 [Elysia crispata]|uniref:Uncharacterized protein n=1 Tax=Elysia crispata TaxID=231223 RepID=A0AAE1DDK3_9GAST|nr:hypothetical protein RRG08_042386 [Elysia crispata]
MENLSTSHFKSMFLVKSASSFRSGCDNENVLSPRKLLSKHKRKTYRKMVKTLTRCDTFGVIPVFREVTVTDHMHTFRHEAHHVATEEQRVTVREARRWGQFTRPNGWFQVSTTAGIFCLGSALFLWKSITTPNVSRQTVIEAASRHFLSSAQDPATRVIAPASLVASDQISSEIGVLYVRDS